MVTWYDVIGLNIVERTRTIILRAWLQHVYFVVII